MYPERVELFRRDIVNNISHKPSAKGELEEMNLRDLLIVYLNWAYRFIPKRPRSVEIENYMLQSIHCQNKTGPLASLINAIERGDDLNPYLSTRLLHKPGYVARALLTEVKAKGMSWQDSAGYPWDKDSCLNNYELHHLHLGDLSEDSKSVQRSKEVAFIHFGREKADIVYIGPHDFHSPELGQAVARWNLRRGLILKGIQGPRHGDDWTEIERREIENSGITTVRMIDGQAVIAAMQTASGDNIRVVHQAVKICRTLYKIDKKLSDIGYVRQIFRNAPKKIPKKPEFCWKMHYTDLILHENDTNQSGVIVKGML